jgi:sialic acid synthase SpsE
MVSVKKKLYIIAEVGSVHDGSFGNACKLIELAADSGAHAVKFQTHFGDAESLSNAKRHLILETKIEFHILTEHNLVLSNIKNL